MKNQTNLHNFFYYYKREAKTRERENHLLQSRPIRSKEKTEEALEGIILNQILLSSASCPKFARVLTIKLVFL